MAAIASIQTLINDEPEGGAEVVLQRIRDALLQVPGVVDVRIDDKNGPLLERPDYSTSVAVATGKYQPGQAFSGDLFSVPLNRAYATKPLSTGMLSLRVEMPFEEGRSPVIELVANITVDGVAVDLVPCMEKKELVGSLSSASLTFDRAFELASLPDANQEHALEDDLAFGQERLMAIDATTGRPIMGPALSVAAVGNYRHITLVGGRAVLHDVGIFQVLEDRFVQSEALFPDSNSPQPMYFTDEGEVVGPDRIKLVPLKQGKQT